MDDTVNSILAGITSGDDIAAESSIKKLEGLPAEQTRQLADTFQELATSPNPDTRWWVIRAQAAIRHPQVLGLLIQALKDVDPSVRQCAALGLSKHPNQQAIPALIAALADEDQMTSNLAGFSLAQIGRPAVPALLEVLNDGSSSTRLRAIRALATIGDSQAVPVLIAALDEDSAPIEHWASLGLERMGVGMVLFDPH